MKIYDLIKSNDALNNINNISSNIEDFNNEVKHNSAIIFVLADWCGHCQDFKPKINDYVQHMSNTNNNGIIALFDDNTMKEANNMPSINGFPSVFSMRNGMKHQDYNGERSKEGLINFSNNILSYCSIIFNLCLYSSIFILSLTLFPYSAWFSPYITSSTPKRFAIAGPMILCPRINGWNGCSRFLNAYPVRSRCNFPLGV